jgi:thioredoxin-like negative regulator of GroEL
MIRSIPTLIYFSGGREIARRFGALSSSILNQWLESLTGSQTGDHRSAA